MINKNKYYIRKILQMKRTGKRLTNLYMIYYFFNNYLIMLMNNN